MMKKSYPVREAFFWILLSVLIVSGSSLLSFAYYRYVREMHTNDPNYNITAIVQTTSTPETLKTVYLAEILDISLDYPKNLFSFNSKEARTKLLSSPLIKNAWVKKIRPGTLHIDYDIRIPVAFLLDYTNTAIDEDGFLLPVRPFLTPKRLPEIYLGLFYDENDSQQIKWGAQLQSSQAKLAMHLLKELQNYCNDKSHLLRIDVSKAESTSSGQREITIILQTYAEQNVNGKPIWNAQTHMLRLNPKNYSEGLDKYRKLKTHIAPRITDQPIILDLRLPQLAYLSGL